MSDRTAAVNGPAGSSHASAGADHTPVPLTGMISVCVPATSVQLIV